MPTWYTHPVSPPLGLRKWCCCFGEIGLNLGRIWIAKCQEMPWVPCWKNTEYKSILKSKDAVLTAPWAGTNPGMLQTSPSYNNSSGSNCLEIHSMLRQRLKWKGRKPQKCTKTQFIVHCILNITHLSEGWVWFKFFLWKTKIGSNNISSHLEMVQKMVLVLLLEKKSKIRLKLLF